MALRAGLIGFGLAGRYFHAPLLVAAGIELKVVSTSRDREVLSIYPDAAVVANADDLIARKDIDLVVIASPNPSHVPHARAALLAGKHVAVDKPLSITSAEARALAELAQKQQRKLAVFQNRRWDSDFLTIRALLERGQLRHAHGVEPVGVDLLEVVSDVEHRETVDFEARIDGRRGLRGPGCGPRRGVDRIRRRSRGVLNRRGRDDRRRFLCSRDRSCGEKASGQKPDDRGARCSSLFSHRFTLSCCIH